MLHFGMGNGWTMNIIQKVEEVTLSGETCLKYRDGDGTDHYFYRNSEDTADTAYYDEDGLGLKLESMGSGGYTMTDKSGNTLTFVNNFLSTISDSDGNTRQIHYDDSNCITGVTLVNNGMSPISVASFSYSGSKVASVSDAAGNK